MRVESQRCEERTERLIRCSAAAADATPVLTMASTFFRRHGNYHFHQVCKIDKANLHPSAMELLQASRGRACGCCIHVLSKYQLDAFAQHTARFEVGATNQEIK
jgi:hypothetical protein